MSGRSRVAKKSTWVDMTAFVDVSFLILTFFILATKFKPDEPVEVTFPASVSADEFPEVDAFMVTIDKDGRVFVQMDDPKARKTIAENLNETRNLGLTNEHIQAFMNAPSIGVPFTNFKSLLGMTPEQRKEITQPGIPVPDSTGGELYFWIRDAKSTYAGKKVNWLIKADNETKYPVIKNVLEAFKRNDINKFQLITKFQDAPVGTALWQTRQNPPAKQ
ncbi:MAG: biopolymer transporter ExbD [Chitinophagaceae bacterium]|nr:biopolymer transporter ExbD [Chitinophagaceae bacterium]MCW5929346.1 biopolymer transporter ExbD [Chitinophagaceae bacterium]